MDRKGDDIEEGLIGGGGNNPSLNIINFWPVVVIRHLKSEKFEAITENNERCWCHNNERTTTTVIISGGTPSDRIRYGIDEGYNRGCHLCCYQLCTCVIGHRPRLTLIFGSIAALLVYILITNLAGNANILFLLFYLGTAALFSSLSLHFFITGRGIEVVLFPVTLCMSK